MYSFVSTLAYAHACDYVALDSRLKRSPLIPCSCAVAQAIAAAVNSLPACGFTDNAGNTYSLAASASAERRRDGYYVRVDRDYRINGKHVEPGVIATFIRRIEKQRKQEERENAYIPASVRIS